MIPSQRSVNADVLIPKRATACLSKNDSTRLFVSSDLGLRLSKKAEIVA